MLPKSIFALLAATVLFAGSPEGLAVHEWGTFTSVAAEDGSAEGWTLLTPAADLPCFVYRVGGLATKMAYATVRMETPVLYFYAAHPLNVDVSVKFPEGLISEWYPGASIAPRSPITALEKSAIEWKQVRVSPDDQSDFPVEPGPSHYYAARNTDSAPLRIGDQHEKLIFYRGIGNFEVPVRVRVSGPDALEVSKTGGDPIPFAMLFDNRGGSIGYRILGRIDSSAASQMPELTGDRWVMQRELESALVDLGLYPREAHAMLETWQDSWFEEGTRVIYLMPRSTVDAVLPLNVDPAPTQTARVFAGRVEVLSPWLRAEIEGALESGNTTELEKRGRFLDAFMRQIGEKRPDLVQSRVAQSYLQKAQTKIQALLRAPVCSGTR